MHQPSLAKIIALGARIWHNHGPIANMKKETKANEAQLLELLKKVLPKATHDAQLAGKIYQAVELELGLVRAHPERQPHPELELSRSGLWDCPANGVSGLTRRAGARREGLASDDGDTE